MTEQRILQFVAVRYANGYVTVISEVSPTHHEAAMMVLDKATGPIIAYTEIVDGVFAWQDIPEQESK